MEGDHHTTMVKPTRVTVGALIWLIALLRGGG
jgi:hypothetical protein